MSAVLSLGALHGQPDNGGLQHVAGPAEATWGSAAVEADEADLANSVDAGLAILTAPAPIAPWQQDALLRRVHERGYRALAVPQASAMDPGTRRLADRLGLTLLDVARPIVLARTCWMLTEGRDALTLGLVRKVAQSFEYSAADLADLLGHLASNLGHAVALIDADGVVHQAGGQLDDQLHAVIDFERWVDIARVGASAAASVRVDSPTRTGLRLALFGAGLGESQLATLSVAAEIAMPAVAARILIDEVAEVNDVSVSSALLRDFLELGAAPDAEVERRMSERGWRTSGSHLGFRMRGTGRIEPLPLLRSVNAELRTIGVEAHATTAGRGVTGWLSFPGQPEPAVVERFAAALRELHVRIRRAFPVATGVGSLRSGAAGLATTLDEAADAARIAAVRSATGWFVRVDSLGLEQLLLAWTDNDTFVPAAASLLAPLAHAGGELLETLAAYLDHESGLAATATALGVHRNTVAIRIRRVQELLGLDFDDPGARLAVHLACRAVLSRPDGDRAPRSEPGMAS